MIQRYLIQTLKNKRFYVTKNKVNALILIQGGDELKRENFKEVYTLYFHDVFKFLVALCHDEKIAEELTQETFFRALKSYDQFRGECKITSWLFQIAKHSLYLYEKQRKRYVNLEAVENEIADVDTVEIMLAPNDQAFEVHKLLHVLQEPYKEVFSLRVLGELSFADIARLFGKTESWSRVTFHRAKLKLIEQLKEEYNDG